MIEVTKDLRQILKETSKPVVMYGMGNGADKIIDFLSEGGIEVADFFASDGFVRGQSFHGKTVLSYSAVKEKYGDFVILVSFGSRLPDVISYIESLAKEHELYIPYVPVVSDGQAFDLDYYNAHKAEINAAYSLLSDKTSRNIFCDIINYRLSGKPEYLFAHTSDVPERYSLLEAEKLAYTVDAGAYNGDSIRELMQFAPDLKNITAFEPDLRTFKKLSEFAGAVDGFTINAYNAALWNEDTVLDFTSGANRNSTLSSDEALKTGAKRKSVNALRLDSVVKGRCDFIKYDVEGAEREAIQGSLETIYREHPKLLVSLYHRIDDIFALPLLVSSLGYEKLFIRRNRCMPDWELDLIAY